MIVYNVTTRPFTWFEPPRAPVVHLDENGFEYYDALPDASLGTYHLVAVGAGVDSRYQPEMVTKLKEHNEKYRTPEARL